MFIQPENVLCEDGTVKHTLANNSTLYDYIIKFVDWYRNTENTHLKSKSNLRSQANGQYHTCFLGMPLMLKKYLLIKNFFSILSFANVRY